jgi:hypothetical protein
MTGQTSAYPIYDEMMMMLQMVVGLERAFGSISTAPHSGS